MIADINPEFGDLDTLVPAYATTIHKSQGSEYPAVVIPVMTQHYAMLQRNLLYTGVTHGERLVVFVGQKKAVAIAVRNVSRHRRWSKRKNGLIENQLPNRQGLSSAGVQVSCVERGGQTMPRNLNLKRKIVFITGSTTG